MIDRMKLFRDKIDEIDEKLFELHADRLDYADRIGKYKAENQLPVAVPEREAEMLKRLDSERAELLKLLLKQSKARQYLQRERPRITLIGLPGCGKDVIAQLLAESHDFQLLNTYEMAEHASGMSIENIFAKYGEAWFKPFEKDMLKTAILEKNVVITVSLNLLQDPQNTAMIKENSVCFYIKRKLSDIFYDSGFPQQTHFSDPVKLLEAYDSIHETFEELMDYEVQYADPVICARKISNLYNELHSAKKLI